MYIMSVICVYNVYNVCDLCVLSVEVKHVHATHKPHYDIISTTKCKRSYVRANNITNKRFGAARYLPFVDKIEPPEFQ